MARTPALTVEQAEAAIGKPRGSLFVTSANRGIVRQWLVAQGVTAAVAHRLSNWQLANAFNKPDDHADGLNALRLKSPFDAGNRPGDAGEPADAANEDDTPPDAPVPNNAPTPLPIMPTPIAPAPAPQPAPAKDAATLLRELILGGWKPGIDANEVRQIVQEQLAGIAPRVIEVRRDGADPVRIEGLVHPEFERCLKYLSTIGPNGYQTNIALVGPAGCGKTHLQNQLAQALGVDTVLHSGSAGATESEIKGWLLPVDGGAFEYCPSDFVRKYERGNVLINFDEFDANDANMVCVLNVPLGNGGMFVQQRRENPYIKRGDNVYFMATLNTFGTGANPLYSARNQLDEATRDRFVFISVDYDKRLEESIARAGNLTDAEMAGIWELRDRTRESQIRRVISTRAFQKAAVMKACGDSWREIRDRLLEGWTRDERSKVGV